MILPDGLIFGIVDNGLVAVLGTILAWLFMKLFPDYKGPGWLTGIYACLLANSFSDGFGAVLDAGTRPMAMNIFLGCLIPIPFVYLWRRLNK